MQGALREKCQSDEITYKDFQMSAGILRTAISEGLMALEEFFSNMPQLYGTTAQSLRHRVDFDDNQCAGSLATRQSLRTFHVHLKISTWLHRTIDKRAATKSVQIIKLWLRHALGSDFRGTRETETSQKHTSGLTALAESENKGTDT